MSDKLDKLRQERDKAERQLRKATNDEKALVHEMARLTRAERTHRLCTRSSMLETFLRKPSLLTDSDVMADWQNRQSAFFVGIERRSTPNAMPTLRH